MDVVGRAGGIVADDCSHAAQRRCDHADGKAAAAYQKAATSVTRNLDRYLEYSQLSKIYPTPKGPVTVVDNFDLKVRKGEFISCHWPFRLRQVHRTVDDGRAERGFARRHHP